MLDHPMLLRCPLFQDLTAEERAYALTYFDGKLRQHGKGDCLHQVSFPLPRFALVLSGAVQVSMDDRDGGSILMNRVGPGELFGTSYSFLGLDAPITILSLTPAELLWLTPSRVKQPAQSPLDQTLANRFIACLAERSLRMNRRIQILSKATLRQKILTFLAQYAPADGTPFTIPFDRASMAVYLGADRSALSRELARMQAAGLLTYHRNEFQLLSPGP